jgi:hypothetical protein
VRFRTLYVSREDRYALQRDLQTGGPIFNIPVSNILTDYIEWYEISESELDGFFVGPSCGESLRQPMRQPRAR